MTGLAHCYRFLILPKNLNFSQNVSWKLVIIQIKMCFNYKPLAFFFFLSVGNARMNDF